VGRLLGFCCCSCLLRVLLVQHLASRLPKQLTLLRCSGCIWWGTAAHTALGAGAPDLLQVLILSWC
jgi:hypothetical protein